MRKYRTSISHPQIRLKSSQKRRSNPSKAVDIVVINVRYVISPSHGLQGWKFICKTCTRTCLSHLNVHTQPVAKLLKNKVTSKSILEFILGKNLSSALTRNARARGSEPVQILRIICVATIKNSLINATSVKINTIAKISSIVTGLASTITQFKGCRTNNQRVQTLKMNRAWSFSFHLIMHYLLCLLKNLLMMSSFISH